MISLMQDTYRKETKGILGTAIFEELLKKPDMDHRVFPGFHERTERSSLSGLLPAEDPGSSV